MAAALAFALPSTAQVLYKWIDASGKVQYRDQPPKNFKGEVTRIEPDPAPLPARPGAAPRIPAAPPQAAEPKAEPKPAKGTADIAAQRRAQREKLAGDVERAKQRLEAARKSLESESAPGVDERQVVRQTYARGTQPGTPRSNCREAIGADGKKSLMCPALVPNEAYYDRMRTLEEAVKRAEDDLEIAERAYRRGTD